MTAPTPGSQTPPAGWAAAPEASPGPAQGLRYAGFWVRLVAFILDAIVLAVITAALVAFDRRKQGWHDKLAGTVVVRPD